jgi:hypothetical protein
MGGPVTESLPEGHTALWYRGELEWHLRALSGEAQPQPLGRVNLAALNFLASGVGLARCVLVIEQASQCLPEALPLSDPESIEDAMIVRESSLRAVQHMERVLALLRLWLKESASAQADMHEVIRELFHAFSNMLVGISCYSELLLTELRAGDAAYAELQVIFDTGSEAARLVKERATLQRLVNDLNEAGIDRPAREREVLRLLIETLLAGSPLLEGTGQPHSVDDLEAHAGALPVIEGRVLLEAARRYAALSV